MSTFNIALSIFGLLLPLCWTVYILSTDRARWYQALQGLPFVLVCGGALSYHYLGIGIPVG